MDAATALAQLEKLGTAQNREVYTRHGVTGPAYGVSYANLGKLRKAIGTSHAVALALWNSGNHDARVLATMVAEPDRLTPRQAELWVKAPDNYVLADAVSGLIGKTPYARAKAERWIVSRKEWVATAGWNILTRIALDDPAVSETDLRAWMKLIEAGIGSAPNRVRYAMNNALIAIGSRGGDLQQAAVAAARRIGRVQVDHGKTGCKTPDAMSYIAKAAAHRQGRTSRRPAGAKPRGPAPAGKK